MGLVKLLLVIVLTSIIFATVCVAQSNYLDSNINTDLDVLKNLGIEMDMSDELRRRINRTIVPNLSLFASVKMIMHEKDRLDVKLAASTLQSGGGGDASSPLPQPPPQDTPSLAEAPVSAF